METKYIIICLIVLVCLVAMLGCLCAMLVEHWIRSTKIKQFEELYKFREKRDDKEDSNKQLPDP